MQDFDEAVITYLDVAGRIFQQDKQHAQPQPAIRVLRSPTQLLRQAVLVAEESEAFTALVGAAVEAYAPTHPLMQLQDPTVNAAAITSFFCRSGVYRSHFSGESISPIAVSDSLQSALSATTHRVKYLAPLELVSFGAEIVDCGSYQIRTFSRQQLDDLLENDVRSDFYQRLRIDTAALEPYWFIVVEGTEPHPLCADYSLEQDLSPSWPVEFSPYPQVLDKALRRFALFSWKWRGGLGGRLEDCYPYWPPPKIPFVITVSDSPIVPPEEPPDMRGLTVGPPPNPGPLFFFELDERRTLDFSRWMQHIDRLFDVASAHHEQWPFIEVATGFLLKGFVAGGPESLIWNVAAIEALLGERRDAGLTRVMSVRLARILGTDEEHKKIRKLFEEIYDFRSAVVHGDKRLLEKRVEGSRVNEARDLACLLLVWMLSWLAEVAGQWEQTAASLPTREQLLAVLDLKEGDLDTVAKLLGAVPSKFPHVLAWLDPEQLGERWRAEDELTPEAKAAARLAFGLSPPTSSALAKNDPFLLS